MAPQTEHSEESSSLPPPELNPLLNPLLAENMGRWAQVYFTSPPEKREQAVHELLRELAAEKSAREGTGGATVPLVRARTPLVKDQAPVVREQIPLVNKQSREDAVSTASPAPEVHAPLVRCRACGRKNPSTQKFCGMCGTHLADEAETAHLDREHLHSDDLEITEPPAEDRDVEHPLRNEAAPYEERESHHSSHEQEIYEPRLNTNELSLFQTGRNVDYYHDDVILSTPPGGSVYRIVIGIVLAIVIGTLAYMAWRSSQQTSQSHLEQSAPATAAEPAPVEPAPAESAPPVAAKTNPPERTPAAEKQSAPPAANPAKDADNRVRQVSTRADNSPPTLPHGVSRPPKETPAQASPGAGAEELAVAQGYLNGSNGQGRNSAEAAKWLWKAIAKHNAQASLLLSDLYLKGEGVSKNCDQARVLLDSAALRGVKDAGVRLRHLQAFGCQ